MKIEYVKLTIMNIICNYCLIYYSSKNLWANNPNLEGEMEENLEGTKFSTRIVSKFLKHVDPRIFE